MGKVPPTLTLLEVGDLSLERFRGIFRLGYQGDAWLEVKCRVQANPLLHNPHLTSHAASLPLATPLLASQPLLVPMTLRLSSLNLRAILILVVSATKGITLVFKNDPLQNVDVSSTFDSIEVIRGYLQQEIEGQLREMFREDLPVIIHRLSQKWFKGAAGMDGRVEMPYRHDNSGGAGDEGKSSSSPTFATAADPELFSVDPDGETDIFPPYHRPSSSSGGDTMDGGGLAASSGGSLSSSPARRRASSRQHNSKRPSLTTNNESPTSYTTFPEIEDYDPTYGLRPEGVPTHSGYEAFGRLWQKARQGKERGLGSLMSLAEDLPFGVVEADEMDDIQEGEEDYDDDGLTMADASDLSDEEDDANASVEFVDASPALRHVGRPSHRASASLSRGPSSFARKTSSVAPGSTTGKSSRYGDVLEWETVSAVGGGTVSRPRIFHAQSQIKAPSEFGVGLGGPTHMPSPSGTIGTVGARSVTARASSIRSSGGGSTLGLGVARSLLGGGRDASTRSPLPAPHLWQQDTASAHSRVDVFESRPSPAARRHSRAESVPVHPSARNQSRQPSRLNNVVSAVAAPSRRNTGSSSLVSPPSSYVNAPPNNTRGSNSRPVSMAGYPPPAGPFNPTPARPRRSSVTFNQNQLSASPPSRFFLPPTTTRSKSIVLPLNDSVSQLATLSHSNHTLSPYARNHEHIAIRSFPHMLSRGNSVYGNVPSLSLGQQSSVSQSSSLVPPSFVSQQASTQPDFARYKAKRKRVFNLGGGKSNHEDEASSANATPPDLSPPPPYPPSSLHPSDNTTPYATRSDAKQRYPSSRNSSRPLLAHRQSYGFPTDL